MIDFYTFLKKKNKNGAQHGWIFQGFFKKSLRVTIVRDIAVLFFKEYLS